MKIRIEKACRSIRKVKLTSRKDLMADWW